MMMKPAKECRESDGRRMIKNMDTIAQYKIMRFIQANFYEDAITVTKVDSTALKVTDKNGESLIFEYMGGEIKERGETL